MFSVHIKNQKGKHRQVTQPPTTSIKGSQRRGSKNVEGEFIKSYSFSFFPPIYSLSSCPERQIRVLAASNHHAPTQRNFNSYEISPHSRVCHPTQLGAILTLFLAAATRLLSSTRPRCQKTKAPTNCPMPATPYHTRLLDAWHVLFQEVVVGPNKGLSNENTASFKPWEGESTRQKAIVPFGKF